LEIGVRKATGAGALKSHAAENRLPPGRNDP